MENLRKRVEVRLINNERLSEMEIKIKLCSKKIFDKDLVVIHKIKCTLTRNKPVYVGMCILQLSKVPMYEFHYDYIKNNDSNKTRLLFTDTDSLVHKIETQNV